MAKGKSASQDDKLTGCVCVCTVCKNNCASGRKGGGKHFHCNSLSTHMAAETGRREVKNIPQHISLQSLQTLWLMAKFVVHVAAFLFVFTSLFSVPSAILWAYINFTSQLKRGDSHEVRRGFREKLFEWPASFSTFVRNWRPTGFCGLISAKILSINFGYCQQQWWRKESKGASNNGSWLLFSSLQEKL